MNGDWDCHCDRLGGQQAVIESHHNPLDELVRLYRDMAIVRARLEEALQDLARRHDIRNERVAIAMDRYGDDLLNAVVHELRYRLSGDVEAQSSLGTRATAIREIGIAELASPATQSPGVLCSFPGRRTGAAELGRPILPTDAKLKGSAGPVSVGGPAAYVCLHPRLPSRP
jgi:hypothetical protein